MNNLETKSTTKTPAKDSTNSSQSEELNKPDDGPPLSRILQWQVSDVIEWFTSQHKQFTPDVIKCLQLEEIDGQVLMCLTEEDVRDFRYRLNYNLRFGELKKLWQTIYSLQQQSFNHSPHSNAALNAHHVHHNSKNVNVRNNTRADGSPAHHQHHNHSYTCRNAVGASFNRSCNIPSCTFLDTFNDCESCGVPDLSSVSDGCSVNIPPEFFKTAISLGYSFLVTWITSFVMVIVHERVPDMKRYPPLPDIFLDNVPHIPWAFHMCEITGTLLFTIWASVCIFHKYRMVILRRFFALAGTVFLLRCVTMLITSLSVPGTHLQCNQNDYAIDDTALTLMEAIYLRVSRAYTIWSGLGMSIQGVRTCGDYMFSGHTVALTLLNFFITEYTPRNLYFLHTLSWLLNMFGIFFILAAHEHYSIDVFVAFYITSRLFLYYHTLANNQALMQRDSNRTRIWFPMFSYFENSVDGIIPNEFDSVSEIIDQLLHLLIELKDTIMLTAYRLWLEAPHLTISSKNMLFVPKDGGGILSTKQRNAATSTTLTATNTPTSTASTATRQTEFSFNNIESETEVTPEMPNEMHTPEASSVVNLRNKETVSKSQNLSQSVTNNNRDEERTKTMKLL